MSDESYAWDRSGSIDPELERWERELAPFRYDNRRRAAGRQAWRRFAGAAAAAVALAVAASRLFLGPDGIAITVASGGVSLNGKPAAPGARVQAGERVVTAHGGQAVLAMGPMGSIELKESSAIIVAASGGGRLTMKLEHGDLRARITARPYAFRVETPTAAADDMGCAYQIVTDSAGSGWLRVTEGWVRLRSRGIDSLVIEGTDAALRTESGPGVPIRKGAHAAVRSLAEKITAGSNPGPRELASALEHAGGEDAATLLNLLWRAPPRIAEPIYRRLAAQHPPPPAVEWKRFENRDLTAVAEWWPRLGFRKTVKLPPAFYPN